MQAGVDESVKVVVVRDTRLAARSRRARATPSMWSAGGGLSDLVNNVKKAGESAASIGFSLDALQQEMDPSLAEGADALEFNPLTHTWSLVTSSSIARLH